MNAGVCRQCEQRSKQLVTASRTGGGSYRRAPTHAMATVDRWSVRSLRNAVERAEQQLAVVASNLDSAKQGDE